MQLARVVGSLVSTRKSDKLEGMKLLVAVPVDMDTFEEKGAPFVTIDAIGAGAGEVVMCVGGSSSRQTELTESKPVDNTIVAIVDSVDVLGRRVFDKAKDAQQSIEKPKPQPEEKISETQADIAEAGNGRKAAEVVQTAAQENAKPDHSFQRVQESRKQRNKKKNK